MQDKKAERLRLQGTCHCRLLGKSRVLFLILFHLYQPRAADLPTWCLTRLCVGWQREAEGCREGELGQMEALLVVETGACGQLKKTSARVFCRRQEHFREEEELMGFGAPRETWTA